MRDLQSGLFGNRFFLMRFLLIWIPLTLLLIIIIRTFFTLQAHTNNRLTTTGEQQIVNLSLESSTLGLNSVRSDLLFLADMASQELAGSLTASSRLAIENAFVAFAARKSNYDQIRFVDLKGRESIRVDWNQGRPVAVKFALLQNKADRYYIIKSIGLNKDEMYVSPLDLNIEHGAIENPIKPTIRFCTPVFNRHGKKLGLIVLNYFGQRLLDRIRKSSTANAPDTHIWLLNSSGYWLLGNRPEDEWGFMYPDRTQIRFDRQDAEAWHLMNESSRQGQFQNGRGLYTYARLNPFDSSTTSGPRIVLDDQWLLLTHVPASTLAATNADLAKRLWIVFALLEAVLTAAALLLTHFSIRRKLAEEAVRSNEIRYRSLLESAPDAIVIVNADGQIELVNSQTEKFFGYTRDSLLHQPVEILIPEALRAGHKHHRENYHANPRTRAMGEGLTLNGRRRDGRQFPVEISLSPIESPNGRLVTAIIRDITTRRLAEQLHQEAQERYRTLLNNLPVGVYRNTAGPQGRFLEANPALVTMLEAESAENLLGHAVSDFYLKPAQRKEFIDKLMQQGQVTAEEMELVTLKGKNFWAAITAVKKIDQQGNIYFDGVIEDISERKHIQHQLQVLNESLRSRSQELEAANHELEAFSYSVSHDLRAPLRAIDGFSQILLREYAELLDSKGQNFLDRIRRAAQHMGLLIDDLLKLSRVTRAELVREEVNLSELAQTLMSDLERQDEAHAVNFSAAPGVVTSGDKRLIQIVLSNLLNNAHKFSGKCPVAHIEFGMTSKNGMPVYFVRDNGAGFDMAYAGKLFGVFQRLHETTEFPGTGIGLATVQRIIHKHNGTIWAESRIGQGATFYFTLNAGANS